MYILHVHVHLNVPKSVYIYSWKFGTFFPIQLGMSSSQLTKSYFRGLNHQPETTLSGNVGMSAMAGGLAGRAREPGNIRFEMGGFFSGADGTGGQTCHNHVEG